MPNGQIDGMEMPNGKIQGLGIRGCKRRMPNVRIKGLRAWRQDIRMPTGETKARWLEEREEAARESQGLEEREEDA